jgi:uncharacterized protein (TIGR03435 family)
MTWITALAILTGGALHAQDKDISGNWQGTLQAPLPRRVVLKVMKADGKLKAVMYSVDANARPIATTSIVLLGSSVKYSVDSLGLSYAGTLNPDGNTISGSQTEGDQTAPLNLQRVSEEQTWAIPQVDKPMLADARPKFEVLTVKPHDPTNITNGGFRTDGRHTVAINQPVIMILWYAYNIDVKQIVGAPAWFSEDKYDLDGTADVEGSPSSDQRRMMFQDALTTRFGIAFHHEQRELPVYDLTVANSGPRLTVSAEPTGGHRSMAFVKQGVRLTNVTMQQFCEYMNFLDRPLADHTGLTGRYDIQLSWTPDSSTFGGRTPPPPGDDPNAPPNFFTALKEQLGLKAEPKKELVDVMVIDHSNRPAAN